MKNLFTLLVMCSVAFGIRAGTMTFTTKTPVGTSVRMLFNTTTATKPISIDWGNGVEVKYTVDPNQMAYNRWITGAIEGSTIKITGDITEVSMRELELTSAKIENMSVLQNLDLAKNSITDFQIVGNAPIKFLSLQDNNLTNGVFDNSTLSLENAAETLVSVDLWNNPGLTCLDLRYLTNLESISANDCPDLASIFICAPEESRPKLRSINFGNCDLGDFYPVSLPGLRVLNLEGNRLMTDDYDGFVLGDYPELTDLSLGNNPGLKKLDISHCTKLEFLSVENDNLSYLDVSQAPNLLRLIAGNNNISSLDLGNNKLLRTISVEGNPIKAIDFSIFPNLSTVNISDTQISRAFLMNAYYLQEFRAKNTNLEFVDFLGTQSGNVSLIDLRDNKNMTGETVSYTIHTLRASKSNSWSSSPNLLLSGSNAETADTDIAESDDYHWICDVKGDGTAQWRTVDVNIVDATDTGDNKKGELDRLYPLYGLGFSYDFDIYETEGGKFLISQWQPSGYFQTMESITDHALTGVPIHIYPYPEEGMKFKSVTVNGKEINDQWFVISENSDIKVNFTDLEQSISFTTDAGQDLSFLVNTVENNGTIWVDWGTGTRTEYPNQRNYTSGYAELGGTRIEGSAASETITIYGDIAALELMGFGDAAEFFGLWDNKVQSINLDKAHDLKYLGLYWNPIKSLDLSGTPNLEVLDVSYTDLKTLDLSYVPNLMWLEAYSDGWGDDGISMLEDIDVSGLPYLVYLNVKNNALKTLDVSKNGYLTSLNASNNNLSSIDVSKNIYIENLELAGNNISATDLSALTELTRLVLAGNKLTDIDLSHNTKLETLDLSNNYFKVIDMSMLPELGLIYINGNGMTADDLNDTYYKLPQRDPSKEDDSQMGLSWNLAVIQGSDRKDNDGLRADSSIAVDRGWTPSHAGSNGGSQVAYLDILSPSNGKFTVSDSDGTVYSHGSKVEKYKELTITAIPDEGYSMTSFSLNGEEPRTGNTFIMPGIYTKLAVTFKNNSGISDAKAGINISAADGRIVVSGHEITVDIFSLDGVVIAAGEPVEGIREFTVGRGMYLVRAHGSASSVKKKIMVK